MSDETPKVRESAAKAAGNRGKGRKPGVPNKVTTAMKEMALAALDELGGKSYLVKVGKTHPQVFLAYVGKFAPSELRVGNPDGSPFTPETARRMAGLQEGE